jgi:hypothetical protein
MRYVFLSLYSSNWTLLCFIQSGARAVMVNWWYVVTEFGAESIHLRWKQLGCCDGGIGGTSSLTSGELIDLWWKCCCSRQLSSYWLVCFSVLIVVLRKIETFRIIIVVTLLLIFLGFVNAPGCGLHGSIWLS